MRRDAYAPARAGRTVRRVAALLAAAALGMGALAACGDDGGDSGGGPVKLRFLSLAWQKASVKVNKQLVAAWNKSHPKIHVQYVQGSWDTVHDQLVTSFEGGDAPDIIHDAADDIANFADQGYLADLRGLTPASMKKDIPQAAWQMTTFGKDGGVYGVPFLQEPRLLMANTDLLKKAGVPVPTSQHPWTWAQFQAAAKKLTHGKTYGVAWPMKEPVSTVLDMSMNYGGRYFYKSGDQWQVRFGAAEQAVPKIIHDQVNVDHTAAKQTLGMSGSDTLPGFFSGKYAMVQLGLSYRQQIVEQAPKDFHWTVLPPLKGQTQAQGVSPQTLSLAAAGKHQKAAMRFVKYFLSPKNQVTLAKGDWMLPTSRKAVADPAFATDKLGWRTGAKAASSLVAEPAQAAKGYAEWMDKVATPAFQQYFSGDITERELGDKLVKDGGRVLARYK